MLFAAGLGSRLKPWTDTHPKALAVVNGKTLLQRNIEYLQTAGIKEVIVNVHHFADQIIQAIEENNGWGSVVTISNETDAVLETGGGLKKAAWYFENTPHFVVMNVDILTDLDLNTMIRQHIGSGALATLAVSSRTTSRYFLFDAENDLCGWRNVNTGEERISRKTTLAVPKAFSGLHVISSRLLSLIGRQGKFSMVDVYLELAKTERITAFDHSGAKFIDVGKPESLVRAGELFS